ncbi:MAG: amino acid adenylation domain-containing protein, partial [Clostridiales bacterium]|nr:amino acid adenylation domain-containing protein [Clostridiales bacterium]
MNLTRPQQLIYDSEKIIGGSIAVMCGILTVDKVYPEAQVLEAIHKIYETNDALNYKLDESGTKPQMYYESPADRKVNIVRVNQLSDLDVIGREVVTTPFDMHGWLSDLTAVFYPDGYGMIIKVHHLIGDAWSMSLIATQLNLILEGTPWVRYSYEEYIDSEEKYLNSKKYTRDREFFVDAFKQNNEPVLFSDKPSESYRSEKLSWSLSPQLRASLKEYVEKTDNSEFVCLFGAFAILYGKLKDCTESFYLGMPVLNRMSETELNTVGMYVNSVPVPVLLDYEKTIADNLQEIQDSVFEVFKHQKFNYNDILKAIGEDFGFQGKLYDCTINYQPDEIFSKQKMRSRDYWREMQTENLQVFFQNRDREEGLVLEYTFRTDVFSSEEIIRLHDMFLHVLNQLLTDDGKALKDISVFDEEEKENLVHAFNATAVSYDKTTNVFALFEEQVKKNPGKTALIAADRTMTYAQLEKESGYLAMGLVENGVKPGDIVALCLPRDSRLFSTILAILKAGAAYLPLDPQQPPERIEYILSDSNAKICITDKNYNSILSDKELNAPIKTDSESVCYCIYTSGSTGNPKGTLISHRNVCNYVSASSYGIYGKCIKPEYERILSVTSVSFDIFVTESLLPLANGKTVVLANEKQSQFGKDLQRLLEGNNVDVIQTTPSKIRVLLKDMNEKSILRHIRCILLGGEALDPMIVTQIQDVTSAEIFNVYGPTETTVWSSCARIDNAEKITIGKPISNTQIYITDRYLNPVPVGVTGELCIAGDGVCKGYLNRPDLTEEKFIDNPFGGGKLYRTGDLAYRREDGNIIFIGRNDFQAKINGQRVELGEIETALCKLEGIESSAVIIRIDEANRQVICAFYTGKEKTASELRSLLSKTLPRYMIPQSFTHMKALPLTTSGKTDRKALATAKQQTVEATDYVAPQTREEELLIATAMRVLKQERIGMLDNFFDLGGDSLKAIAWISLLEQNGYTLHPGDIFSSSDMTELKEKMGVLEEREYKEPDYPEFLPLTVAQKEVYTAQSIVPDKPVYNIPYFIKVQSLDVDKLQHATDCMLKRHEILRTRFETRDGELIQTIDENAHCQVEKIEGNIKDFVRPFDLSKAPLIRVGYQDNIVAVDLHHLVADGSSMSVFFKELNDYYMGREPEKVPVPYKYFAVTQKESSEDKAFWDAQFADEVSVLNLRADGSRTRERSYDGKSLFRHIPEEVTEQITAFCKSQGITPFVFYYGAFQILLKKYTLQEDIVVGAPISRRNTKNIDTIGMFVHTLPLRCRPEGEKTTEQFFNEIRELSLSATQHIDVSANEIATSKGTSSLFDTIFSYQTEEMVSLQFADAPAQILETPLTVSKFDIEFSLYPRRNEHVLMATYDTALFREETIQRMMLAYERILSEALDASKRICDISILEDSEKEKLLHSFNATTVPYDKSKSVYALFEEQVNKNGQACIRDENREYTFAQLNEDASKIDSYIRKTAGAEKQV